MPITQYFPENSCQFWAKGPEKWCRALKYCKKKRGTHTIIQLTSARQQPLLFHKNHVQLHPKIDLEGKSI